VKKLCIIFTTVLFFLGCQKNPQDEYSAKILEVQEALNAEDYNRAISLVESLPAEKREVIKLKSMAYAGRAGFNALKIADFVSSHKDENAVALVYKLADTFYSSNAIDDINKALINIRAYYPNLSYRPADVNAIYGLLQLYKASQLILKNVKGQNVTTCEVVSFIVDDVIDLMYSINSAALSLSKDIKEIREKTQSLRLELNVPEQETFGQQEVDQVKLRLQEVVYEELRLCDPTSS
jgi:hypothetical protein